MTASPTFAAWSDEDLHRALSIADEIVIKAAALGDYQRLAMMELRLRNRLADEHIKIARKADKALVAAANAAEGDVTPAKINGWVNTWVKAFSGYADKVMPGVADIVTFAQYAGKRVTYQRLYGAPQELAVYQGPPYQERISQEVAVSKATLDVKPSVTLIDLQAAEQITKGQRFWVGRYHSKVLNKHIQQVASDVLIQQGLPYREAGVRLGEALGYVNGYRAVKPLVTVPKGWSGSTLQYWDGVAANAATVSRIHGALTAMVEVGILQYTIINALDERTCTRCELMNGAVLDVKKSYQQIVDIIGGGPFAAAQGAPWLSEADFVARHAKGGAARMQADGVGYPPFHFKCRCTVDIQPDQFTTPVQIPPGTSVPAGALPVTPKAPTFNASAMAQAMASETLSASQQAAIREQLRLLLLEDGGMVSQGEALGRSLHGQIMTKRTLGGASGSYNPRTGLISVRQSDWDAAKRFAKKAAMGRAQTAAAMQVEAEGFSTIVHEAIHDTSKAAAKAYKGIGAFTEEMATESASRHIMVRRFGRKWDEFGGYARSMRATRQAYIRAWKAVAPNEVALLNRAAAEDLMGRVGIEMGRGEVSAAKLIKTPDGVLGQYVKGAQTHAANIAAEQNLTAAEAKKFARDFSRRLREEMKRAMKETW